ncbi:MAG: cell division protein SepF [Trebonia sp.]
MASAMRKMAVYLGLVEDDRRYAENYEAYDEYDDYDEPADAVEPAAPTPPSSPSPSRADYAGYPTDHRIETVPPQQVELARITTLHPRTYNEARNIGEHFRDGTPVIMNLTEMVDSDARRLVDFAAGLIFGLRGSIDKVTNKVFLLSPANVEVTAEDKARIAERGFFNQS